MAFVDTSASVSPVGSAKHDRAAASRQKSCNACVRGKRRCDKKTPQCTRCAAKGLDCVYQRLPPGSSMSSMGSGVGAGDDVYSCQSRVPTMADFDINFDMDTLSTDSSNPDNIHSELDLQLDPHLDPMMDFSIVDLVSGGTSGSSSASPLDGRELWNLGPDFDSTIGAGKMDLPPVPTVPRLPVRDLTGLMKRDTCSQSKIIDLVEVYNPQTSLGFIVKYLTNMHVDFSKTRLVPWMHPRLYPSQPPKTIMAAFSASMAQANSSPQNKGWTCKLIMEAAREVHREGERADTPLEKLARLQALVILQAIRLFDGDMTLRTVAEREMIVVQTWLRDLAIAINELEGGATADELTSRDRPPKNWESWILLESMRRSYLMCMSLLCLVAVLKTSEWPLRDMEPGHYFTASRHLWEATSSTEFYRTWREKPQFCVKNFQFSEFWQYAQPENIDEFTKLFLSTQVGPDGVAEFMDSGCPMSS